METLNASDLASELCRHGSEPVEYRGALIRGVLNLRSRVLTRPIRLIGCSLPDGIDLRDAKLAALSLDRCATPEISAAGMRVEGHVSLLGARFDRVDLDDGQVAGNLTLSDVDGIGAGSAAFLQGRRLIVDGHVSARRARLCGGIDLEDCRITGELVLDGAELGDLHSDVGASLVLDSARLGRLSCDPDAHHRFRSHGEVRLLRTVVLGECRFRGALLEEGRIEPGQVLTLDGLTCDRLLCDLIATDDGTWPFDARGEVRLPAARIATRMSIAGASLSPGPDGDALYAEGARIGWLDAGVAGSPLTVNGRLCLAGAVVDGDVWLEGAMLHAAGATRALDLDLAQINGILSLHGAVIDSGESPVAVYAPGLRVHAVLAAQAPLVVRGGTTLVRAVVRDAVDISGCHVDGLDAHDMKASRLLIISGRSTRSLLLADVEISHDCDLSGSHLSGAGEDALLADGARFGRLIISGNGDRPLRCDGGVRAVGAVIAGDVLLQHARIDGSPGPALVLQRLRADVLSLASRDGRSEITGGVDASGARVTSVLDLRGARLRADDRHALVLDGTEIGSVVATPDDDGRPMECHGGLSLAQSHVLHDVRLAGALLVGEGRPGLSLLRARCVDVICRPSGSAGTVIRGGLAMQGAEVTGVTDFAGATIGPDADGDSIVADNAKLGRLILESTRESRFEAAGTVRLPSARIDDELRLGGARVGAGSDGDALFADDATIGVVLTTGLGRLDARGTIRFVGAIIRVDLDLTSAQVTARDDAILLTGCTVGAELKLHDARLSTQTGSSLQADRATIGSVRADSTDGDALYATGTVSFESSTVADQLVLAGATVQVPPGKDAVVLRDARAGTVDLSGTRVLSEASGTALAGQRLRAVRVIALGQTLEARGAVRLQGAQVEEEITLQDAQLVATPEALDLARVRCPTVEIGSPFAADQRPLVEIDGEISLAGGAFANRVVLDGLLLRSDRDAVTMDRAVAGALRIGGGLRATQIQGTIRLLGAMITGQVLLLSGRYEGGEHPAVDASGATIGEFWLKPSFVTGDIVLLGASARRLMTRSVPASEHEALDMGGFAYERWDPIDVLDAPRGWQLKVLDIAHGTGRSVEPYELLAKVLRTAGDEQTARRALSKREHLVTVRQSAALAAGPHGSALRRVRGTAFTARRRTYDLVVGYGYREGRALVSLLVVIVIAWGLVAHADAVDGIVSRTPASCTSVLAGVTGATGAVGSTGATTGTTQNSAGGQRQPACVSGAGAVVRDADTLVLAIERVVPAIDLGERSRVRVTGGSGLALGLCSILGWVLTIALLAAATKTLRRD